MKEYIDLYKICIIAIKKFCNPKHDIGFLSIVVAGQNHNISLMPTLKLDTTLRLGHLPGSLNPAYINWL